MSMTIAGNLRRIAQSVRHLPGIRNFDFIWNRIRMPYQTLLRLSAGNRGIPVKVGGVTVQVDPRYGSTSFETVEAKSYAAIKRHLQPGDLFFDVGAAIGCYTMVAASCIGESGKVIAFEPDPDARIYLRRHLAWNGLEDRVTVREVCCGRQSGDADLFVSPQDVGGQASVLPVEGFRKIHVNATSLDDEYRNCGRAPSVIKIDVEGAEWDVLQGAVSLLSEAKPVLLLSIHPSLLSAIDVSENQILRWLADLGYQCEILERDHEVHVLAT